jgi:hypothetical protein
VPQGLINHETFFACKNIFYPWKNSPENGIYFLLKLLFYRICNFL